MGARSYWYFVPYDPDVQRALRELQQREVAAGRYNPVVRFPVFGAYDLRTFSPVHAHIAAARDAARPSGEGTRSILDIVGLSEGRKAGAAAPLSEEELLELFDTTKPTREVVDRRLGDVFGLLARGECVYLHIYDAAEPVELLFAGYSYD
jgi:hypothetical protein